MKRKILIFTGSRSEYGIMSSLIKRLSQEKGVDCHLLVSGTHLKAEFGKTDSEIDFIADVVIHKLPISTDHKTLLQLTDNFAQSISKFAKMIADIDPDIIVIYGDRTESFAVLLAAAHMNILIAHIEGGDVTSGGTFDDNVRHAMTKLSHLHFATNRESANRLIQMGEHKNNVVFSGSLIQQIITNKNFASVQDLKEKYNLLDTVPIILFTQHPSVNSRLSTEEEISISLSALEECVNRNYQIIITYANNDIGGDLINRHLQEFSKKYPAVRLIPSLGWYNFHGVLDYIAHKTGGCCLGNSSAGLKETIFHQCPSVNIGDRQKDRLFADNVIHANFDRQEIIRAVEYAQSPEMASIIKRAQNPYARADSIALIVNKLITTELSNSSNIKYFNDLKVELI